MDAFIARQGHQDIHKLRGLTRPLTRLEKAIFVEALIQQTEDEVRPLTPAELMALGARK